MTKVMKYQDMTQVIVDQDESLKIPQQLQDIWGKTDTRTEVLLQEIKRVESNNSDSSILALAMNYHNNQAHVKLNVGQGDQNLLNSGDLGDGQFSAYKDSQTVSVIIIEVKKEEEEVRYTEYEIVDKTTHNELIGNTPGCTTHNELIGNTPGCTTNNVLIGNTYEDYNFVLGPT